MYSTRQVLKSTRHSNFFFSVSLTLIKAIVAALEPPVVKKKRNCIVV